MPVPANTFSDESGTYVTTPAVRCNRKSRAQLAAGGWVDMNRAGCAGEWRRTTENTETRFVQEVYSSRGTLRRIIWTAK